ncbi:MAG: hypothetical protein N2321_04660 [Melioribacteraceae bacterium]|nr:hypothetical protein [Melioribacteraceae bacterium]
MFEREIKFIYDFNLNKVNKLGPYFTFEQLQNSDLHPAILHYISAEIDYLVFEDRQKLLKNSVFDYSGEKISYYFNLITEELKRSKRFSIEYIAKLILHATSFTINFLVRPRWTITRFIFDESKHKTTNEIKQILNYIYYYKYLKTIITSYINTKKILSMNNDEFDELITKTDKLSIENNFNGIVSTSFMAMAEFFNIGQMQKTKIPLTAVELFLEEKNLLNHLQKITDVFGSDENAVFHISDYIRVLNSVVDIKDEILEEQNEPELNFENQQSSQSEIDLIEQDVSELSSNENFQTFDDNQNDYDLENIHENKIESVENNVIPENEIKDFQDSEVEFFEDENIDNENYTGFTNQEIDELTYNEIKVSDSENENVFNNDSLDNQTEDNYQLNDQSQESEFTTDNFKDEQINNENIYDPEIEQQINIKIESETEKEINFEMQADEKTNYNEKKLDINEIIEHKDVSKIIETIFDYDFEDFANAIDEVSACKNIDDALLIINDIFSKRKINPNSKEAESLKQIISEYFNQ